MSTYPTINVAPASGWVRRNIAITLFLACIGGYLCSAIRVSTAQEQLQARLSRGRQVYVRGTSPSGKAILAYIGDQSLEVPGSSMPCANCHGLDGSGKPEGGIDPSNITQEFLTKPYASTQSYQRKHQPYTDRAIELAITRGIDPSGNRLLTVMPRYVMTREDLSDLVVYMSRLGKDRDPGITENKLVIATVLPARGAFADMGAAVRAVLTAYFEEVNNAGGIYNRRVELKFAETGDTAAATRKSIESLLSSEQVFAFTSAFIAGAEKEVLPLFSEKEVPLVGPITLYPQTTLPLNRQVFYQLSGIEGQERVLAKFAANKSEIKKTGIAIVSPENDNNALLIEAIRSQTTKSGLVEPQTISYVPGAFDAAQTVRQLRQTNRGAVFFLGPTQDSLSFMRAAAPTWFPYVFLSGLDAEIFDAPAGFDQRIFMAFPTSPADQTAEGTKEFRSLAAKYQLPTKHVAAQISAYSAAKVLVEGLKRTGKDLSREKLVGSLEGLFEFRTGLSPAVTFGPNRRIGAMGAYVITINLKDRQFLPIGAWIDID